MRRFFCDSITTDSAAITGDDAHHISRVLRMKAGDALSLCDGAGNEYDALVAAVSPEVVVCTVSNPHASEAESPVQVSLFQCLPKAGKMELIVQKCTELGVFSIVPVQSARCVVVPGKDYDKKRERYNRVALEAAKQSRRAMIPRVLPLTTLKKIDVKSFDLFLVAYEDENTVSLKQALRAASPKTIALLIGPEGGLEESEIAQLVQAGAKSVSLGRRILRTETAGMAMLAQTLYEVEE